MGDFNIKPEVLEASGLLETYGLTLVKPDNVDITCTSGDGAMLDYALVATNFMGAIVSPKADTTIKLDGVEVVVPQGKVVPNPALKGAGGTTSYSQSEYLVYKESQATIRYVLKMEFQTPGGHWH